MSIKLRLFAFSLFVFSSCLYSQSITTRGSASCGEWIQEVQQDKAGRPAPRSAFWLLGYLFGISAAIGKDLLRSVDSESLYAWVSNYCKANPLEKVYTAGDALSLELIRRTGQ